MRYRGVRKRGEECGMREQGRGGGARYRGVRKRGEERGMRE